MKKTKPKKKHLAKKTKNSPSKKSASSSAFLGNVLSFSWFKKAAR